jgi:MFS family permease
MTQEARLPHRPAQTPAGTEEPTLGALVHQLSEEIPHRVRSEIRLAQAEVAEKGRRVGVGLGMFSGAGLLAFFGLATLVATAVIALAEALPGWAAALIVAAILLLSAGVLALIGKRRVSSGQPLKPERAVAGVREDVAILKEVKP